MKTIKEQLWSLDNLISWLEAKNPEEVYDYSSTYGCLLSQYMRDQGFPEARHLGGLNYILMGDSFTDVRNDMPVSFYTIASPKGDSLRSTFGEALDRAYWAKALQTTLQAR